MTADTVATIDRDGMRRAERVSDEQVARNLAHVVRHQMWTGDHLMLAAGYPSDLRDARADRDAHAARADAAEARVAEMVEALRPFAKEGKHFAHPLLASAECFTGEIMVGDLRAAVRLVAQHDERTKGAGDGETLAERTGAVVPEYCDDCGTVHTYPGGCEVGRIRERLLERPAKLREAGDAS